MKRNQTSLTAMGIAMLRALESDRPPEERLIDDPYARKLIPGWLYWMGKGFTAIGYGELRGPGVEGFLAARERHIDEVLQSALDEGAQQVVILGAGFDARAYRFDRLKEGVKVYEVDLPATQEDKRKRLEKIFGRVPEHVTYVGIDFNTQSLGERMAACGYRPDMQTLFIWQGVTQYLAPEAVDATLAWIARCSGAGSKVVFDYVDRSVLESRRGHAEIKNVQRYGKLSGERISYGIPDGTIVPFLESRGFTKVKDARPEDLHRMYFTGARQKRKIAAGYGLVSAMVPAHENAVGDCGG